MRFLIAYDIADPRRLQRVARFLERRALRCQKSVFLLDAPDVIAVTGLLEEMVPLLHLSQDCVQAWKLSKDQPRGGLIRGTAATLYPSGAVLHAGQALFVKES